MFLGQNDRLEQNKSQFYHMFLHFVGADELEPTFSLRKNTCCFCARSEIAKNPQEIHTFFAHDTDFVSWHGKMLSYLRKTQLYAKLPLFTVNWSACPSSPQSLHISHPFWSKITPFRTHRVPKSSHVVHILSQSLRISQRYFLKWI